MYLLKSFLLVKSFELTGSKYIILACIDFRFFKINRCGVKIISPYQATIGLNHLFIGIPFISEYMITNGWIKKFWFSTAENTLDLNDKTLFPSDVVASGKISIFSLSDNNLKILYFCNKLSDLALLIKTVPANFDKKPKIGQFLTSDLATNFNGNCEPKIGISK